MFRCLRAHWKCGTFFMQTLKIKVKSSKRVSLIMSSFRMRSWSSGFAFARHVSNTESFTNSTFNSNCDALRRSDPTVYLKIFIFHIISILHSSSDCRSPNQERRVSESSLAQVAGIFIHLQRSYLRAGTPCFSSTWLFFNLLRPDSYNSACPLWSFS